VPRRLDAPLLSERCDIVEFDEWAARRCVYKFHHYGACKFGGWYGGVCMRRSTNVGSGRTRYCALTVDHYDDCIFLWLTERDATREERGLPVDRAFSYMEVRQGYAASNRRQDTAVHV
jgi:hypothetical protein